MDRTELLHRLRGAGLTLTLTPSGGLYVAPRAALTDAHREAIRAARDDLVFALQAEAAQPAQPAQARRSGNPLITPDQGDECHAGGWNEREINTFMTRVARFSRRVGESSAEQLAERLTLRDRQHDDRRICLECAALAENRRCEVAARGRLPGTDRRHEPVPTILQRCPGFMLEHGLD